MRIITNSLGDFLENLGQGPVVGGVVWVNRTENPMDGNRRDAIKYSVVFQASAVCDFLEGQYLLELGVDCGHDVRDCNNDCSASEEAERLRAELIGFCSAKGLAVRPGIIDM